MNVHMNKSMIYHGLTFVLYMNWIKISFFSLENVELTYITARNMFINAIPKIVILRSDFVIYA